MIYILPTDTCFGLACLVNDFEGYNKIYEIKGRDFNKPLAIMLEDFKLLEKYLNINQINFLKNYYRPWTIMIETKNLEEKNKQKNSEYGVNEIEKIINYVLKTENGKLYKKFAFRVANNDIQKSLISNKGPIFLTSANLSGEKESYTLSELKSIFGRYKGEVKILAENDLDKVSPSDIFEFIGESTNIDYLRKN